MSYTRVIKLGGTSGETLERMNRNAVQQKEMFGRKGYVVVHSAMGKTTYRIDNRLTNGGVECHEDIFQEFEKAYPDLLQIASNEYRDLLRGYRSTVYSEYESLADGSKLDESAVASRHLDGEMLASLAYTIVLNSNGVPARWIGFQNRDFPMIVKGDYINAKINLSASRKRAERFSGDEVLVFPGYGGISRIRGEIEEKTAGRGGSDTMAFGYLYAFEAGSLWICTDTYGILNAMVDGAETVKEMDVQEMKEAAMLGVKLPRYKSAEGLERYYNEGIAPTVYIANSQDMKGEKTSIVRETREPLPVKVVSGRDVLVYEISGNVDCLPKYLNGGNVDWVSVSTPDFMRIVIPADVPKDARRTEEIIERFAERHHATANNLGEFAYAGIVGKGMKTDSSIANRATSALRRRKINTEYFTDPGAVSMGFVIKRENKTSAIEALYHEFFKIPYSEQREKFAGS